MFVALALIAGCGGDDNSNGGGGGGGGGELSQDELVSKANQICREGATKINAKAQDIQAMSDIWGSKSGPARATMDTDEMEKRLIYLMRCLRHDSYSILNEQTLAGGDRQFNVQLKRGALAPSTTFTTTTGPQGRWYLVTLEPEPLNQICTSK